MTRSWRIYYWRGITLGITLVSFEKIEEENLKQRRKRKRFSSRQVKYVSLLPGRYIGIINQ